MIDGVGFIGLGKMGGAIAGRLLAKSGRRFVVFDTRKDIADQFVANGATYADSPAAVASSCEVVFASLPTPAVVREVALGAGGVIEGGTVRVFIDVSTTGPQVTEEVATGLAAKGIDMIDSPVSGGIAGAVNGTLAVMVAGKAASIERCADLLAIVGKVFRVGERPGLGQTMKLCNNLLSSAVLALTSEAMVLGVKAGLDPQVMLDVINTGSGRNSATTDKFPRSVLPRTFDFGFSTGHMYKDVKLCMEVAEHLGVQMWVAPAVRQIWLQACREIGPDSDFTAIVKCIERLAGVEVKAVPAKQGA
jgi:3-hydroxyisobutyrate dehydrogenase-like beta-hydroxyacid dehydrogenase